MRVALTFDTEFGDQPHHSVAEAGWAEILDVLAAEQVRGTFFVIGSWALRQPDLLRRTFDGGHLLGNHTMDHVPLGDQPQRLVEQLDGCDAAVSSILGGHTMRPWMRLPYLNGDADEHVLDALAEHGWEHVKENADTCDWNSGRSPTAEYAARNAVDDPRAIDPVVVLMHSWPIPTAGAVRLLIDHYRGVGAEFVTVDDLTPGERAALPARG